jgi:glycosyltransferase involved in cell wall biosynthesis
VGEKRPAVLVFANDDWGQYRQTRHQIVSRLAQREWPVFYTQSIFTRWEIGGAEWRNAAWPQQRERRDGITFYWPGRLCTGWPRFSKLDAWLRRRQMAAPVQEIAKFTGGPPIAYLFHPKFVSYLDLLAGFKIVYHADDTFAAMGKLKPELVEQERELVERADLIITSSSLMAEALPLPAGKAAVVVPNGADSSAFERGATESVPAVLRSIPTPRIGYIGSINDKVDMARIAAIAESRPDWHWCIAGRVMAVNNFQERTLRGLEQCRQLPNVHFLGEFPAAALPALVNHMDVNTMIYRTDGEGWWKNIYPLKLHEYLATGKPVVSARVEAVLPFSTVVDIVPEGGTVDQWIVRLDQAILGQGVGAPESRRAVARANDWNQRVDMLEKLLQQL